MKHIGMRTIKTGIGIFLCVLLSPFIVKTPLYAALACTVSIQTSVKGSITTGFSRIKGTILGGIIGFLFSYFLVADNALICALGSILTIYLCIQFNMKDEVSIAVVTFLSINLGSVQDHLVYHSIQRVIDNSVGVFIGICVNYLLARPNHAKDVIKSLEFICLDIEKFLDTLTLKNKKQNFHIENLESLIHSLEKTHLDCTISIDYNNISDGIYIDEKEKSINNLIIICKELCFHIQSITHLEQKLYINSDNYEYLKDLYPNTEIKFEIDETKSPVFNYHLNKVLSRYSSLKEFLIRIGIEIDIIEE